MRTIHKAVLPVMSEQAIYVQGFRFLRVGKQNNEICMWYECMPNEKDVPLEKVTILCFGTGQPINYTDKEIKYLGTVITHDGRGVWHFYRKL